MTFREQMVGLCTLAAMALLGMALYSGTYSMIYASIGISVPTVAILEMWMTSVHLFAAVGCCLLQGLYAGVLNKRDVAIPHLADAQTALFLGVSCAVTILGNECVQYGECAAYYGAASFPRMAAAGSIAWAWIMYLSSLGCQDWERGLTLGFNGKEALTAASVMVLLPIHVMAKLHSTCGWSSKGGTLSSDTIFPTLLLCMGLVISHLGGHSRRILMLSIRALGFIMLMGSFLFMPGTWGAYHFTAMALACNTLLSEVWRKTGDEDESAFSLSGLKHHWKGTFFGMHHNTRSHTTMSKKKNRV